MFKLFLAIAMVVPFIGALSYLRFQDRPTEQQVQTKKENTATVKKFAQALETKKLGLVLVYNKESKLGPKVNMSELVDRSEKSLENITSEELSATLARYAAPSASLDQYEIPKRAKIVIHSLVLAPMVRALLVVNRASRMPDADMTEIDLLRRQLRKDAKKIGDGYTYEIQSAAAVLGQDLDTTGIADELNQHLASLGDAQ
jgi:hypothetical protein